VGKKYLASEGKSPGRRGCRGRSEEDRGGGSKQGSEEKKNPTRVQDLNRGEKLSTQQISIQKSSIALERFNPIKEGRRNLKRPQNLKKGRCPTTSERGGVLLKQDSRLGGKSR